MKTTEDLAHEAFEARRNVAKIASIRPNDLTNNKAYAEAVEIAEKAQRALEEHLSGGARLAQEQG